MNTLAIMPRWFRVAAVIAIAGVSLGGTAGSAYALPRGCSALQNKINAEYAKAQYFNVLAAADANDGAWDDYQWCITQKFTFWMLEASNDTRRLNSLHCYS